MALPPFNERYDPGGFDANGFDREGKQRPLAERLALERKKKAKKEADEARVGGSSAQSSSRALQTCRSLTPFPLGCLLPFRSPQAKLVKMAKDADEGAALFESASDILNKVKRLRAPRLRPARLRF